MKKRLIALVCLIAILVGVLAFGATATEEKDGFYDVGYAKVDMNPWVQSEYMDVGIENIEYADKANYITNTVITDPTDSTKTVETPIAKVPLAGFGNSPSRLAESMTDDNGDGIVGKGDGLHLTCTSVTDDWGKTVMYITIDTIGGYDEFTNAVRKAIVAELGANVIHQNDIMVSGSHSHEAPDLEQCEKDDAPAVWKAYYDYCVAQAVAAARQAFDNKTPATMKKGTVDGSDVMKQMGYTYSNGEGVGLSFVRHYKVTKGDKTYYVDSSGKLPEVDAQTQVEHVADANDAMNILQFVPKNGGKSTVLIQWQAHPSMLGSEDRYNVSSDYVNALRYRLENNSTLGGGADYNVGFWQGTGGNLVPTSKIPAEFTFNRDRAKSIGWASVNPAEVGFALSPSDTTSSSSDEQNGLYKSGLYGYILGKVALKGLEAMTTCDMGNIRAIQVKEALSRRTFDEGLVAAARQWESDLSEGETITYPYRYTYNGEVYGLTSKYQAQNILKRADSTAQYGQVELNAIVMGEQMALVTASVELFDRYDENGSVADADNDWNALENELGYAPFILSKSNGRNGYLPNTLAYDYYTDPEGLVTTETMGCYETNVSLHAQGSGEQVVAKLADMLALANDDSKYLERECPACEKPVVWEPLMAGAAAESNLGTGHYYLVEDQVRLGDKTTQTQKSVAAGETLCINLNGYLLETEGRSFSVASGGTLNLLDENWSNTDPAAVGIVRSYSGGNNPGGGVVSVSGTMNLYGGQLELAVESDSTAKGVGMGGIASIMNGGVLNMSGGKLVGANLVDTSNDDQAADGTGGAVFIYGGGTLNMSGGSITSGTVPETVEHKGETVPGKAPCVYLAGAKAKIKLSGDADVGDIYFAASDRTQNLTVSGAYTGTTNLTFASELALNQTTQVGVAENDANIDSATVTFTDDRSPWALIVLGEQVQVKPFSATTVACIYNGDYRGFDTLEDALADYEPGDKFLRLMKNTEETVTVDKNVVMDLNAKTVNEISVNSGFTLYCFDNATDKYDAVNVYGKIKKGSGDIQGLPESSTLKKDGYLKVNEEGVLSFHAVDLQIYSMVLRPVVDDVCMPSVYYQSYFKADFVAARNIESYGIAMNTTGAPTAENLKDTCKYSTYTGFVGGATGNAGNGTLLKGIMKPTNHMLINKRNANVKVYGTAYIKTKDGYMLGDTCDRTLVQQTVAADKRWSELEETQKAGMLEMYKTYNSVMDEWELPNLSGTADPKKDGKLKVLVIGNSHGVDATRLLYEVFEDQGYTEQELVLGALYYSGCSVWRHGKFMTEGQAVYTYYENSGKNEDGSWDTQSKVTADVALNAHQWDIVILQQMNHRSGYEGEYKEEHFNRVINYVKDHQAATPKFGWHMVWTNPDAENYVQQGVDKTASEEWRTNHNNWFPGENGTFDQDVMYEKIVYYTQEYIEKDTQFLGSDVFDFVIPSCTAVQYAQDHFGYTLGQAYRDYTHLSDYSRLMVSYLWYAKIMGLSKIENVGIDAIPAVLHQESSTFPTEDSGYEITPEMQDRIIKCVNWALEHPYSLTEE